MTDHFGPVSSWRELGEEEFSDLGPWVVPANQKRLALQIGPEEGLAVSELMALGQHDYNAFAPKRHDFAVEEWCVPGDDRDVYRAIAEGRSETRPRTFNHAGFYLWKSLCKINQRCA
jgi:hypothetical protein